MRDTEEAGRLIGFGICHLLLFQNQFLKCNFWWCNNEGSPHCAGLPLPVSGDVSWHGIKTREEALLEPENE